MNCTFPPPLWMLTSYLLMCRSRYSILALPPLLSSSGRSEGSFLLRGIRDARLITPSFDSKMPSKQREQQAAASAFALADPDLSITHSNKGWSLWASGDKHLDNPPTHLCGIIVLLRKVMVLSTTPAGLFGCLRWTWDILPVEQCHQRTHTSSVQSFDLSWSSSWFITLYKVA